MNNNEPAAEHYSINGFKYFSELAKEYFPDLANASSASKKMRKRIKADKTLNEQLAAAYYTCQTIDIRSRNATNPLPPLGTSPHRPADQRLIT